jgi:hypothetical protein
MTKSTKMWSVHLVYSDSSDMESFLTEEELRNYLIDMLRYYSHYIEVDIEKNVDNIETLIYYIINICTEVEQLECNMIIEKVHMLDFEKQNIVVYE